MNRGLIVVLAWCFAWLIAGALLYAFAAIIAWRHRNRDPQAHARDIVNGSRKS